MSTSTKRRRRSLGALLLLACACEPPPPKPHGSVLPDMSAPPASAAPTTPTSEAPPAPGPIDATPPALVVRPEDATKIDRAVAGAIASGACPGAVVRVQRGGRLVYEKAYGKLAVTPKSEPMRADAVFDLASLTKPLVTATAVMQLVDQGLVDLDQPAKDLLPELADPRITPRQLLAHVSGLPAVNPMSDYRGTPEEMRARLFTTVGKGSKRVYSDLGYQILGALVEKVSGRSLDAYFAEAIASPLDLSARYNPPASETLVPTSRRDDQLLRGAVHDPRAAAMGGVAGHAGLFGTARDVARYGAMLLAGGALDGQRVLSQRSVDALLAPEKDGEHTLAFSLFDAGISHTGFTGTYVFLHPESNTVLALLTSRLHPEEKGDVTTLRRTLRPLAIAAARGATPERHVETGIDVLRADAFAPLAGARVGLVTNDQARAFDGTTTAALLKAAPNVTLVRLFSPEHGLAAAAEGSVADGTDPSTGLPVVSLYGPDQKPSAAALADLDTLVVDLQDAGARFYTYLTTLGYTLEAAAKHGKRVVVLDRPNPVGATTVAGPLLDADRLSFVGYHPIPVQPGMTIGELAKLFAGEKQLTVDLTVIPLRGYHRSMLWSATGLPWRPPSPNLRDPEAALLYPGVALVEATNLSVGRGTPHPFHLIGAPWLNAPALLQALDAEGHPGLHLETTTFTPTDSKFAGIPCNGLRLAVDDPTQFQAVRFGLTLAAALLQTQGDRWRPKHLLMLLGNAAAYQALVEGKSADEVLAAQPLDGFLARRAGFLLYP
ncbi:MAG: DUF1343 domain-containing protein [Myxococcales bacterium]|nr:DUF1343 domain-containing protein [Myxococcales bacterium]